MTRPLSTLDASPRRRHSLTGLVGIACVALLRAAPANAKKADKFNRSVDSIHQPVVSNAAYLYDLPDTGAGMTRDDAIRFDGWLNALNVGYGDRIALAGSYEYASPALRADIDALLARRGMFVGRDTSAEAGTPPSGAVRLILRKTTAFVPGCPDWHDTGENNGMAAISTNYGCGVNSNLAAMVADPQDLVRGQSNNSILRSATSANAIKTYREKTPTGAGDLQSQDK
jgi:pilus assembly protein CpaD